MKSKDLQVRRARGALELVGSSWSAVGAEAAKLAERESPYSDGYVAMVARGVRKNEHIEKVLRQKFRAAARVLGVPLEKIIGEAA